MFRLVPVHSLTIFGGRFWLHSLSTATIRQISRFGGAFCPDDVGTRFSRNDCLYRITRHRIHYHRDIYFHHRANLNLKDRPYRLVFLKLGSYMAASIRKLPDSPVKSVSTARGTISLSISLGLAVMLAFSVIFD